MSEATIETSYTKLLFYTCGQKTRKRHFKDAFVQILVLSIFDKPRGDHTQKGLRRTNKLIATFWNTYPPQMCHVNVNVIQSCNVEAIGCEAESTPKIEFLFSLIIFLGNVSTNNRVLIMASWISYWQFSFLVFASNLINGFKTPATESNFIHSSFRFVKSGFVRSFVFDLPLYWNFYYGSDKFCLAPGNFPFIMFF